MQEQVNVTIEQNTYQFTAGLVAFIKDTLPLFKDGFSLMKVPGLITSVLTHLVPALERIGQLKDEEKEDVGAFIAAIELNVNDLVKALLQK